MARTPPRIDFWEEANKASPARLATTPNTPPATTSPAAPAPVTAPAPAQPHQGPGFEAWLSYMLNQSGGRRTSGRDNKVGGVYRKGPFSGLTIDEATAAAVQQWNAMSPEDRMAAAAAATPAAVGGSSTGGGRSLSPPPKGFTGLGNRPPPTSSVASELPAPGPDNGKLALEAKTGITRNADGTVTTSGGGVIRPTDRSVGPQQADRTLTSPYGTGSVTYLQPGQPRTPGLVKGNDGQWYTFAQAGQSFANRGIPNSLTRPPVPGPAPAAPASPAPTPAPSAPPAATPPTAPAAAPSPPPVLATTPPAVSPPPAPTKAPWNPSTKAFTTLGQAAWTGYADYNQPTYPSSLNPPPATLPKGPAGAVGPINIMGIARDSRNIDDTMPQVRPEVAAVLNDTAPTKTKEKKPKSLAEN